MLTFSLQCLTSVLFTAFAATALAVARGRRGLGEHYRASWLLAGSVFSLHAASDAGQNVWGGAAIAAGGKSATMAAYLHWAPALNHSRTLVMLAFAVMLVVLAVRKSPPDRRFWWAAASLIAFGMVLGFWLGMREGPIFGIRHFPSVAWWDTVELVVFLSALFAALLADRMDRYLWAALATYAFCVALSVVWFAALSRIDDPNAWTPAPWHVAGYRVVLTAIMVSLALRCLLLARRGARVRGLLQTEPRRAPMLAR